MKQRGRSIVECKAKASSSGSSLTLYGEIGQTWLGDGITAESVMNELAQCTGDLAVYINSPGGNVSEGLAIHSQLKRYDGGKVTCYVDGMAASIASVIALAGSRLEMSPASLLMIHEAHAAVYGNAADLEKVAADLRVVTGAVRSVYTAKTGMSDKKVGELMAAETWLSAEDCVAQGFADAIVGGCSCGCTCGCADGSCDCSSGDCGCTCKAGSCDCSCSCCSTTGARATARLVDTYRNTPAHLRQVPQSKAMAEATMILQRDTLRRSPASGNPRPAGRSANGTK